MTDRIASHPDDPSAPFVDRLMLALGMSPSHREELGDEELIAAAAQIRSDAHRFSMCSEDYVRVAQRWEMLKLELDRRIANDQETGMTQALNTPAQGMTMGIIEAVYHGSDEPL